MKKRISLFLVFSIILSCAFSACATTGNEQWFHNKEYQSGTINDETFGYRAATLTAATVYVGQKSRFHALENCTASNRIVTVAFLKSGSTNPLGTVTRSSSISASKNQYYPSASSFATKVGNKPFGVILNQVYCYRLTTTVPASIEGIYGGYLSTVSG